MSPVYLQFNLVHSHWTPITLGWAPGESSSVLWPFAEAVSRCLVDTDCLWLTFNFRSSHLTGRWLINNIRLLGEKKPKNQHKQENYYVFATLLSFSFGIKLCVKMSIINDKYQVHTKYLQRRPLHKLHVCVCGRGVPVGTRFCRYLCKRVYGLLEARGQPP